MPGGVSFLPFSFGLVIFFLPLSFNVADQLVAPFLTYCCPFAVVVSDRSSLI